MTRPIYLDYHATTPVDPRVLDRMLPFFTERFGNPASRQHAYGWEAQEAVDTARAQVAALIGASAGEIVFTSGASESNNLAIKGATCLLREKGNHIVTSAIEHKSVLDCFKNLEADGWRVSYVGVDRHGIVDLDEMRSAVTGETVLVSVMAANNEIGSVQPLADIAGIAEAHGSLFHTDAAQAVGKVPIDVRAANVDMLSLTAHKFYGPKGSGALYIRRRKPRIELACQIHGGGHENGYRSGTLNVPGIVGLGAACEICRLEMAEESHRLAALRERLLEGLRSGMDGVQVNGPSADRRLPHNLHVSFAGIEGERLLMALGLSISF
jgi:cysteine desulfurase